MLGRTAGKSTLLEGLAAATGLPAVGADSAERDPTLASAAKARQGAQARLERRTTAGSSAGGGLLRVRETGGSLRTEMFERSPSSRRNTRTALPTPRDWLRAHCARRSRSSSKTTASTWTPALTDRASSACSSRGSCRKASTSSTSRSGSLPQSQLALLALIADGVAQSSQSSCDPRADRARLSGRDDLQLRSHAAGGRPVRGSRSRESHPLVPERSAVLPETPHPVTPASL